LVDRIVVDHEQATSNRFADSVQTAFFEGKGVCQIQVQINTLTKNEEIKIRKSRRYKVFRRQSLFNKK
ncbi:MAG: hypothetical protein IKQ50_04680, partial [Paludibacteraceae bacterium]|nr:hypothetical protein [Paludibacteraceae bacterium]